MAGHFHVVHSVSHESVKTGLVTAALAKDDLDFTLRFGVAAENNVVADHLQVIAVGVNQALEQFPSQVLRLVNQFLHSPGHASLRFE
jgi:hypothetical protein